MSYNLHAATYVNGNDKPGRELRCRYILRPPFANHRLHSLPDGKVQLDFKRPWSDGTNAVVLAAHAFLARLAAIIPPTRRHVTRYFGVLSSHSALRTRIIPTAANITISAVPVDAPGKDTPTIAKNLAAMGLATLPPAAAPPRAPPCVYFDDWAN
jgi:hypothetical protein